MTLTRCQRHALRRYQEYRLRAPTLGGLLMLSWKAHVFLVLVFLAGSYLCFVVEQPTAGWILIGMLFGALLRDVGLFRRFLQLWPALEATLDWQRVDEMLGPDRPTPGAQRGAIPGGADGPLPGLDQQSRPEPPSPPT
jgi:hypothetical protein